MFGRMKPTAKKIKRAPVARRRTCGSATHGTLYNGSAEILFRCEDASSRWASSSSRLPELHSYLVLTAATFRLGVLMTCRGAFVFSTNIPAYRGQSYFPARRNSS